MSQRTCEVEACEREEVFYVVMSQFHHDQADQSPATQKTDQRGGSEKTEPTVRKNKDG